jgi:hypothetical protein
MHPAAYYYSGDPRIRIQSTKAAAFGNKRGRLGSSRGSVDCPGEREHRRHDTKVRKDIRTANDSRKGLIPSEYQRLHMYRIEKWPL